MTARRYSYGIRIEGVGRSTSKSEGICWYWGQIFTSSERSGSDYEWVGGPSSGRGLVNLPDGSDSSASLWSASLSCGTISPQLHLEDVSARALMRRKIEPVGYVDADIAAADATITLSSEFASSSYEGTVVFLADEAILLDTHNGAGEFDVTRGFWGTRAEDIPRYTRVFDGPYYRKGREITLVRYDHDTGTEETRWFGALNDAPPTNDDHTRMVISATEVPSIIASGHVNQGAPDLAVEGGARGEPASALVPLRSGLTDGAVWVQGEVRPRPPRVRFYEATVANSAHRAAFQLGETLIFGRWSLPNYLMEVEGATQYVMGAPQAGIDDLRPVHEVLVVARELDVINGVQRSVADMYSSTAQLANPFHPIEVWLALSIDHPDYNVLGPAWNLGLSTAWFDLTDIKATIERTRHLKIDRLVLGYDGEEVNPWAEFKVWCRTYGLFTCIRSDGRITVREAREAGPEEVFNSPTVTARPHRLHWRPSEGDGVDIISGRYGELPWRRGAPFEVQILDFTDPANPVPQRSRRSGVLADRNVATIHMPTRSDVGSTAEALNGIAAARQIGAPKLGLRVDDDGFGHGDFVRLNPLNTDGDVLRDGDGERIAVDDSARWVGVVVMKRPEYEYGRAEIDLHLGNYSGRFPRFRSATAVIESASTDTMTLEQGVYVEGGDDGAEFTVGDKVQIWTSNYARRSDEVLTIDAINAHEIVFTTTPSTAPQPGDKIELAFLNDSTGYPEDGNPALYDGLAYTFMCDDDNTLGPNDLEGHIFGQGAI